MFKISLEHKLPFQCMSLQLLLVLTGLEENACREFTVLKDESQPGTCHCFCAHWIKPMYVINKILIQFLSAFFILADSYLYKVFQVDNNLTLCLLTTEFLIVYLFEKESIQYGKNLIAVLQGQNIY